MKQVGKILDLFCGAGGAAMGLHRAFPEAEIVGVDIKPQKHYPFKFIQADAMTFDLSGYDFIWASPTCQSDSISTKKWRNLGYEYPETITATAERLRKQDKLYCIENVTGARRKLNSPFRLCGLMFGLKVVRHRWFETNFLVMVPPHPNCSGAVTKRIAINEPCGHGMPGHTYRALTVVGHGGNSQSFRWQDWKDAMGIDWMTKQELTQAVPPAYSEWIGKALIETLKLRQSA